MRHFVALGLTAAVVMMASPLLAAPILQVTATDGTWTNAVPLVTVNNTGTPRTARWGTPPLGSTNQSGYNYTPNATPISADVDGVAFLLGTFQHLNYPITGTTLSSIDLAFSMSWGGSFTPSPLNGTFSFTHDETPNNANPCAYGGLNNQGVNINGCADRVTVSSPLFNTLISDGVNTYFFTMVGFSQDGGATSSFEFLTIENQTNRAGLYGRLTSVPISVAEPGTMLLLGLGLVGVATRVRRRS
jgi:hypothetical protein